MHTVPGKVVRLAWLVALGALNPFPAARAEPFVPHSDAVVVERLPASLVAARALGRRPGGGALELEQALEVAREHIRLARAEGDPRHYGYAQGALARWWRRPVPPTEVRVLRAVVAQARHDFEGALSDLERALQVEPDNAQAWLTRATVLRVRGDSVSSRESCRALFRLVEPLVAVTCFSAAAGPDAELRRAHARLDRTLAGARDAEPRVRQWALTVLGELAVALGDPERAEGHFRAGLDLGPRNVYLLGAYADLLLDWQRANEVRALLRDEGRSDALLLRLALAERRLGDPRLDAHRAELAERFEANRRRGDTVHLRDAARAALWLFDDPPRALSLALESWRAQREPWDARLVLEAALAARRPRDARPVLQWLRETGMEHRTLSALARQLVEMSRERPG